MAYVAVYGTLKKNKRSHEILEGSKYIGNVTLTGFDMYDLGQFPALVRNYSASHPILAEVYDVSDDTLGLLDFFEGFTGSPETSLYVREIYVSNKYGHLYLYTIDPKTTTVALDKKITNW